MVLGLKEGAGFVGDLFDWDGSVWQVGDRVFKMSWGVWIKFGWFLENRMGLMVMGTGMEI